MVRTFPRHHKATEMLRHRRAWLMSNSWGEMVFKVYGRDGKTYRTVVRDPLVFGSKDPRGITSCDCHAGAPPTGEPRDCWHAVLAFKSARRRGLFGN